jgi:cytochrome P450
MASHPAAPPAVPGPPASLLTGNAAALRRDLLGEFVRDRARYGDLVRYQIGPRPPLGRTFLVAHHPEDVRLVLSQTGRTLTKDTAMFRAAGDVLGHSLLTDDGPGYRRQRRIVQPLFTARQVRCYAPLMLQEALATADALADEGIAPGTAEQVDLHLLAMRYTLRVVGRTLFGDDVERLVPVLDDLMPQVGDAIRRRGLQVAQVPMRWPTLRNRRPRRLHRELQDVVQEVLASSARSGLGHGRDDLIGRLYDAADPAGAVPHARAAGQGSRSGGDDSPGDGSPAGADDSSRGGDSPRGEDSPAGLTAQEVRDQALVFLLAGHETTAVALTSTLHLLGCHRDVQDDVVAELDSVLGPGPVRLEDVDRLVVTRAALQEAMRLYPPAYAVDRVTTAPLELAGHLVPPGTVVAACPWSTHRHPGFWPDPERFDPARFLGSQERPRYAWFPFGGGPRSCVGEHFAMLEATVLLAALLRRYTVTAEPGTLHVLPCVTLHPVGSVPAVLTRR